MILLVSLLLLAAPPAGAQGGGPRKKGYFVDSREQCMAPGTFFGFLNQGVESWGVGEDQAQRAVDLLGAAVQCRAFAEDDENVCGLLAQIPGFGAAKQLAANCRNEFHLLAFYAASRRGDPERAQRACEGWYGLNTGQFAPGLKAADVCARVVKIPFDSGASACRRFGDELAAATGEPGESGDAVHLCRAVFMADRKECRKDALFSAASCQAYGAIVAALRTRAAKDCPKTDRYGGLCRAMIDKDPKAACDKVRKEWQGLLCAPRFASQHGGGE